MAALSEARGGGAAGATGAAAPPTCWSWTSPRPPPRFAAGLVGMADGDEQTLYVHPRGDVGMRRLFGAGLPANVLLVFNVVCVCADVGGGDEWGGA